MEGLAQTETPQEETSGEALAAETVEAPVDCKLAVSVPYWADDEAIRSLRMNADSIDHVSVFWYHLTPKGTIDTYKRARQRRSFIEFAQGQGIRVFALIANLPDDEREGDGLTWDSERVGRVLATREKRQAHITELTQVVKSMNFDGLHIDYEGLPARYQLEFTAFIAELGEAMRREGKLLAVAVHSKTSERNPAEDNGSWAQDWAALIAHVDQLHLMTYSQHTAGTPPGPVAGIDWFEPIVRYAAEGVGLPSEKVFVGLPLYAEHWRRRQGKAAVGLDQDLTFEDVRKRAARHKGEEFWSEEHQSPYLVYKDRAKREHVIWFENRRSSERKLDAIRSYGLCNLALWRLGEEDPDLWPLLRRIFSGPSTPMDSTEGSARCSSGGIC